MSYYLCGEDLAHGAVGPFKSMLAAAKWHEFQAARGDASATVHKDSQFIITGVMIRNNPKYKDYLMNCCTPEQDLDVNGDTSDDYIVGMINKILDGMPREDALEILGLQMLKRAKSFDDGLESTGKTNWDEVSRVPGTTIHEKEWNGNEHTKTIYEKEDLGTERVIFVDDRLDLLPNEGV